MYEDAVKSPCGKGIEELHHKLDLLREGKVMVPTPKDLEKKESMRALAEEAGAAAKSSQIDVVEINAEEEAKKGKDANA